MQNERLMAALDGARLVKYDTAGFLLAWFGGYGVNIYDASGKEFYYFMVDHGLEGDALARRVEEAMTDWINSA